MWVVRYSEGWNLILSALLFFSFIAAVNCGQLYDEILDLLLKKILAYYLLILTDFSYKHSINMNVSAGF